MSSHPRIEYLCSRYRDKITKTAQFLSTDPRTKKTIQRAQQKMKWRGFNFKLEAAAEHLIMMAFRELRRTEPQLNDVKVVLIDDEFPEAGTVIDQNFPPYIHISTSLFSLLCELAGVQTDLSSDARRHQRPLETQVAALRYLALQWSFHGLTGTIGRRSSLFSNASTRYTYHLIYTAISFILAHEAAHILLGHDRRAIYNTIDAHNLEYEADAYGFELLHKASLIQKDSAMTSGTMLVLDGFDFVLRSQWVIPPQSHPSAAKRTDNLVQGGLLRPTDLDEVISKVAWASSDTVEALPSEFWHDLLNSRYWVTDFHSEQVYSGTVSIDMMCGMDEELLIDALQEILNKTRRRDIDTTLILQRIFDNLSDSSHGLSFQDIADTISKDNNIKTIEPSPYRYSFIYITQIMVRNLIIQKEG